MNTAQINETLAKLDRSIAALRCELHKENKQTTVIVRQNWSTFEREHLLDDLQVLVDNHAMKFDRKKISIMWEIYRQMRTRLGIE